MGKEKLLILKAPMEGKKNIVRDFVYGCWCDGRRIGGMQMPPLNDLYVATTARARGADIVFCDAASMPEQWANLLDTDFAGIGAVAIMSSTQSFRSDADLLGIIKSKHAGIRTIMFGSHPTFMPEAALQCSKVDYIVLREPEISLSELAFALLNGNDVQTIQGIGFKDEQSGEIVLTEPRPLVDMDDLPIPDRSLLPKGVDYFNPVIWNVPYTTIQTSRGCPGKCIFCTVPGFYGKRIRTRSAHNVVEELKAIKKFGYREVMFRDETFTAYRERNMEICKAMITEGLDLTWIANARADMIDKESMEIMKRAGCHMIKFGVETGNDHILKNYRKGTTTAQCRKAFADAHEVGLETHAHIVLGGPEETEETLARTIDFVKDLDPTTASFGILTPYPGTDLFDQVAEKWPEIADGTLSNMDNLHVSGFYSQAICGLSGDELSKWVVRSYRKFYLRPSYLIRRLAGVRSFNHFMTLAIAGLNIFSFSCTGKK